MNHAERSVLYDRSFALVTLRVERGASIRLIQIFVIIPFPYDIHSFLSVDTSSVCVLGHKLVKVYFVVLAYLEQHAVLNLYDLLF